MYRRLWKKNSMDQTKNTCQRVLLHKKKPWNEHKTLKTKTSAAPVCTAAAVRDSCHAMIHLDFSAHGLFCVLVEQTNNSELNNELKTTEQKFNKVRIANQIAEANLNGRQLPSCRVDWRDNRLFHVVRRNFWGCLAYKTHFCKVKFSLSNYIRQHESVNNELNFHFVTE